VQRILDGTTADPADDVDEARVAEMLAISYVGLATDAAASGKWDAAKEQVENAVEAAPSVLAFAEMLDVLTELAELPVENDSGTQARRNELLARLATHFASYANGLAGEGQVCDAVVLVENAIQFAVTQELQELQNSFGRECAENEAMEAIVALGGHVLYSTGGGGVPYAIWRFAVTESNLSAGQSTLIVQNAAQPRLNPNGTMLAYYSWQGGADGLYITGVNADLTVWGEPVRLGSYPEDSKDSPPSWNSSSTELAYSTSRGNESAHIFVTSLNNNNAVRDLGFGKDPAWRLRDDMIVFNGPDGAGQNPGLRAMKASGNGSDRYALTSVNGNDQRPVWTSDGRFVVFMSKDRTAGASWEVYRLELVSGEITLLTDGHPGQDGLPAVSPDDKWVALMSDRSGEWNLYYVSLDGGPVYFLSELNGQPLAWLEHSVQWVK
jgi:serine/threonine-protein kinase